MKLSVVYDGWDGYQRSLALAIEPLNEEQLAFRGSANMRSVGEIAFHLSWGRMEWFQRMGVAEAADLLSNMEPIQDSPSSLTGAELAGWLDKSWAVIATVLDSWTTEDLAATFEQPYQGKLYAVSRQWVIWRILTHDVHHGGQLSELLAMQGIEPVELTWLGGHLTEPTVIRSLQ